MVMVLMTQGSFAWEAFKNTLDAPGPQGCGTHTDFFDAYGDNIEVERGENFTISVQAFDFQMITGPLHCLQTRSSLQGVFPEWLRT